MLVQMKALCECSEGGKVVGVFGGGFRACIGRGLGSGCVGTFAC